MHPCTAPPQAAARQGCNH